MPSLKVIKRRILSVTVTKKVMKAINMVAMSKLQRVKQQMDAARPMVREARRIVDGLSDSMIISDNVYMKPREVKNTLYIVISGNRGLCGGYNAKILEAALSHMGTGRNERIIAIGKKGRDFLTRRGKNVIQTQIGMAETASFGDVYPISSLIASLYRSGDIDEVYVAYTEYKTALSHIPQVVRILPIEGSPDKLDGYGPEKMKYETGVDAFLDHTVPMYLNTFMYGALLESTTCENAARIINMDSAVNNAAEIIDKLTLMHNRKRQAIITQEISEIVNGVSMTQ